VVDELYFENNSGNRGGAVLVRDSTVYVSDSVFYLNSAEMGGTIYSENSQFEIHDSSATYNHAQTGGFLYTFGSYQVSSTSILDNVNIRYNTAE